MHQALQEAEYNIRNTHFGKYCELWRWWCRSNRPEVFLAKSVLKIFIKFTREHPCRSVIEIRLRHGCSLVNLMQFSEHLFLRTPMGGCFWWYLSCWSQISNNFFVMKVICCKFRYQVITVAETVWKEKPSD